MRTDLVIDRGERKIIVVTSQDVAPILEHNKTLRGERQTGDWGRHVATVPAVILVRWLNEEYARGNTALRMFTAEFNELVARKLGNPDWRFLRTNK